MRNTIFLSSMLQAAIAIALYSSAGTALAAPNFLVIIGDDMGVETLPCYELNDNTAVTPTLDNLCAQGMRLTNVWSQPSCSPTRATLMTGRYAFRTGVGAAIPYPKAVAARRHIPERPKDAPRETGVRTFDLDDGPPGLRPDEFTLAMALKADSALGYETAAIGKWHLADADNGAFQHPNLAGFDHFSGTTFGPLQGYFAFSKQINGELTPGTTVYPTTDKVNDAIDWLDERDGNNPWFMWLGFHNPHSPHHRPPAELLHSDAKYLDAYNNDVFENPHPYFKAMMEAMDTEIGRLLSSLTQTQRENTYVVFIGDNGTAGGVVQAPFSRGRAKGSVYQGGLNVPIIVTGPGIQSGRSSDAIINTTDLFATLLDLAAIDIEDTIPSDRGFDSISFAPLLLDTRAQPARDFAYADKFGPGSAAGQAIRNGTHKLVINEGVEELFDLSADPYEHHDLLAGGLSAEAQQNYNDLKSRLADLLASE
jgi:arylsulfatase B